MDIALWRLTASELSTLVRSGTVSASEVIEAHMERISAVNDEVNAVTDVFAAEARAAAVELDRLWAAGHRSGPLAGVPFTVKDNTDVAGHATSHGLERFRHFVATTDAPPVARLRAAGAIPIGHTNLPTLTIRGMHTVSDLYGHTRNPWDRGRTPGGSSGGDAVAVATGMAPIGLGNDAGGSLRLPAAFNGVAALKPSFGRCASDHRFGPVDPSLSSQIFPVDGPIARSVADLRLALGVLAGSDPSDPRTVPAPLVGRVPSGPVRVGVVRKPGGVIAHTDVLEALDQAALALDGAGYLLEEVSLPQLDEALKAYNGLIMTEFAQSWPIVKTLLGEGGGDYIEMTMDRCPPVDLPEYLRLTGVRLTIQREWAELLDRYPLLLAHVFAEPPVEPEMESSSPEGLARFVAGNMVNTASSFVGLPAVAVPTGVAHGLPQGVQVMGAMYREDLCLEATGVIEGSRRCITPIDPR
jgi:amidase